MKEETAYRTPLEVGENHFRTIIEKTPAGVCITNEDGIFEYANPSYYRIYGYTAEELIGNHFTKVVPDHLKEQLTELHDQFFREGVEIRGEWEVVGKSGERLNILADAARIVGKDGRPKKVTFVINITDRKKAERELEHARATLEEQVAMRTNELTETNTRLRQAHIHLMEAQQMAQMGSWEWDISENRITWSDEVFQIFETDPNSFDATYEKYMEIVHPEDRPSLSRKIMDAVSQSKPYSVEHRLLLPNGRIKYLFGKGRIEADENGNAARLFGIVQDISFRKRAESEIRMHSEAIEESINMIFITSAKGKILYANKSFENITGYLKEEIIGQNPRILSSGQASRETYSDLWKTIKAGNIWRGELKNKKKNGENYWVKSAILPIRGEADEIVKFMAIQEDITVRVNAEKKVRQLTTHDQLTGVFHRRQFIRLVEKALFDSVGAALILFDIDEFTYFNETYGHNAGDEVLKRTAIELKRAADDAFESDHFFARLGENKFAVFTNGLSENEAVGFAEQTRKRFAELDFPPEHVRMTMSAGVVSYPKDGNDMDTLLNALDAAVIIAKKRGKDTTQLFSPNDYDVAAKSMAFQKRKRILKAIEENRFEAWFQPIFNLKDRQTHHFEILARMRDEEGNIVLPGAFINAAETFGLIGDIDRLVAEKAMTRLKRLKSEGRDVSFAMNLSGKEIGDERQLRRIKSIIDKTEADPEKLIFEITETAAIADLNKAISFVDELKKMGCQFSLDDFGVGFTSFSYLRDLKVDYIKIDGAFIRKLDENPHDRAIVKAMTEVAKGFHVKTIAEFVENESILQLLYGMKVDFAQGFHIGRPCPEPVFHMETQNP